MTGEVRPFVPDDEPSIRRVMAAAFEVDAFPGFNADDLDREAVAMLGSPQDVAVAIEDGIVRGYVYESDLTVHPEYRRRGHGRRLIGAGVEIARQSGLDEIRLYVPASGAGPKFARAMGLTYRSSLWRLDLQARAAVPAPSFPVDVVARQFGDWLALDRFVELLNRSFESHPTPLSWTVAQIEYYNGRPDFDPSAVLLVAAAANPVEPIGFVRVSVAPPEAGET